MSNITLLNVQPGDEILMAEVARRFIAAHPERKPGPENFCCYETVDGEPFYVWWTKARNVSVSR